VNHPAISWGSYGNTRPINAGQVMELLEGPDLFDFLAERSSKLEEVKAVGLVRPADR